MASIKKLFFANRIRTSLTIITFLVGLYALAGFIIVPWLARPKIEEAVTELTNRETSLEKLQLNPFTFSGTLSHFTITDTDSETLLSFDRAYGNLQLLSFLFRGEIHFKELDLTKPYFRLQVEANGSLNIADIINQITALDTAEADPEAKSKAVKVNLLKVNEGSISVTDLSLSVPFSSIISPINFDITGFHTSGESDAPYAFSATSESGESFSWKGFVALEPVRSKGSFEVKGFSMPKYEPFYDIVLQTDIIDGTIGVTGSYEYRSGQNSIMQLINAGVTIENVEVAKGSDQSPVMSLQSGLISGVNMDYMTQALSVESVEFIGGTLFAKRLEDGEIDLLALLKESPASTSPTDSETPSTAEALPAPNYQIKKLSLEGFSINITDEAVPGTASFALDDAKILATDISSEAGSQLGLNLGATVRSGGIIGVKGSIGLQPMGGNFEIALTELALEVGNPYIAEFAEIQLASGYLSVLGNSEINLVDDKPKGGFQGKVELADLKVIEKEFGQDLASLTGLIIEGIEAELDPMSVKIEGITLRDLRATIQINEDGSINLMQALGIGSEVAENAVNPEEAKEPDPAEEIIPFPISIGSITLENMGAILTDRSISPTVSLSLETLSGTISGLSSEELARADLDLIGTLTGGTQLAVTGKINPLIEDRYSDMEMSFKDFNLTAVSPYSGKYAGYALNKGKLSFDLKYKISQSELTGENVMIIDQLTLGDKVESEDALKLPIPLAISLMKDRNGVIEIDVPVSGNLNDPEFGFGRVISRAIVNIITKLITSPFSMLGGLIPGGKDVDLSMVSFNPAATEFDDDSIKKLGMLADALKERPNLSLEIAGGAGGSAEVNRLMSEQLTGKLKSLRWRELKEAGNSSVTLEEVALTQGDHDRLIGLSFNLLFPEEAVDLTSEAPTKKTISKPVKPIPVATTETKPKEEEETGGIAGFFRKIFSTQPTSSPKEVATSEPESIASQAEATTIVEAAEVEKPMLTVAQMEARILDTIEVSEEDLNKLADARAESVRAFLETTGEISTNRLFIVEPEDPTSVNAQSGEPKVIFNLE